jgi:urease accessory protein
MAVLLSEVGRRGRLDLTFSSRRGQTVIRDSYCEVPFKITRLHDSSSGIAHLILMQCTAGLFGGDAVECAIHVEPGARVLITQQSATKVHPSGGKRAIQSNRIRVEAGGEAHIYHDPVIPFSGARLLQTTSIDVEEGARLCFWEGLMAGRIGRGEIWQFDEFSSETCLRLNGRPLYLDRFSLAPGQHAPVDEWIMANGRYLATGLYFDQRAASFAERLHDALPEAGVDTPAAGLAVVRVVAGRGPDFHRCRAAFEAVASVFRSEAPVLSQRECYAPGAGGEKNG